MDGRDYEAPSAGQHSTAVPADCVELSVVAPCFDEAGNLRELCARVLAVFAERGLAGELLLVDDGSRDQSAAIMAELARAEPRVRVLRHARNRGIEAGWQTGVHASAGRYVCLIDADLQNRPEDIARLYDALHERGAGMVQAQRMP